MSYACKDRVPFVSASIVQNGYRVDGHRRMVVVPFRMAADCRYQATDAYADKQCIGCAHKKQIGEKS